MAIEDQIKIQTLIKSVKAGQSEHTEAEVIQSFNEIEGFQKKFVINNASGEVAVDLADIDNVNCFHIRGEYQNADPDNGIEKFDPAEVEIEQDGSTFWETITSLTKSGPITSLKVRINAAITQDVRIFVIVGATG